MKLSGKRPIRGRNLVFNMFVLTNIAINIVIAGMVMLPMISMIGSAGFLYEIWPNDVMWNVQNWVQINIVPLWTFNKFIDSSVVDDVDAWYRTLLFFSPSFFGVCLWFCVDVIFPVGFQFRPIRKACPNKTDPRSRVGGIGPFIVRDVL